MKTSLPLRNTLTRLQSSFICKLIFKNGRFNDELDRSEHEIWYERSNPFENTFQSIRDTKERKKVMLNHIRSKVVCIEKDIDVSRQSRNVR
jgi:hypothetical protein